MSKKSSKLKLPLKNITSTLNSKTKALKMSYTNESSLASSPMSSLAVTLSELSTGRTTPRLRRKLSLSSLDTPPNGKSDKEQYQSAESGCFSGSSSDDSPTLESISLRRYRDEQHSDLPFEAFSIKKRTISFRRFSSEPIPALRFDSPTDFLDEDKDENSSSNEKPVNVADEDEGGAGCVVYRSCSEETCSQDSGLGMEQDRLSQLSQRSSVSSFDDGCSVFSSNSSLNHLDRLPSLEEVWNSMDSPGFKAPQGIPRKRRNSLLDDRQFNEDTCSPTKYSPVKSSLNNKSSFSKSLFSQIPEVQDESHESMDVKDDDGFRELFTLDDLHADSSSQVSSLMSATLLHQPGKTASEGTAEVCLKEPSVTNCTDRPLEEQHPPEFKRVTFLFNQQKEGTPSGRPVSNRRGLHRSQSLDIRRRPSIKRPEPSSDGSNEDYQSKRFRSNCGNSCASNDSYVGLLGHVKPSTEMSWSSSYNMNVCEGPRRLHRCHSETEAMIKSAVSRMFDEPDLIGDCSRPYCLPTVQGKHQDLKSISPDTLAQLLDQQYSDDIEEFHVIDCRYPYEFEGGHVKNALNVYTKDAVNGAYLKTPWSHGDPSKRKILIFHCEFSSERGPTLFRFLRQKDRDMNKECYPFLHYPEIYLLEGGYKKFFESYPHLCEPQSYTTMFDKKYSEDLRKFRAKCKSWSEDKSQPRSGVRTLRF